MTTSSEGNPIEMVDVVLKPCPFCGDLPEIVEQANHDGVPCRWYIVSCVNEIPDTCPCSPDTFGETVMQAAERWNVRAPVHGPTPKGQAETPRAELREALNRAILNASNEAALDSFIDALVEYIERVMRVERIMQP